MKSNSIFESTTIQEIYKEIQDTYLKTKLPWIIGYSGGKDSTVIVQLIWIALTGLDPDQLKYPVSVISSDTLVETPIIINRLNKTLALMGRSASEQNLPFSVHKVTPEITNTFWVNLIGRGYAAPNQRFRWCTDRMKIQPANKFVLDRAEEFGQVVMVLGSRRDESTSRAQVIAREEEKRSVTGTNLRYHHIMRNAYVYTPIQEWTTNDVWTYLLQVKSPFGSDNRQLAAMYRSANDGECPLVIDNTTPSCGSSRFGCWTCTVVARDKSMEAMIDNGEEWMEPMLDFRDELSKTQIPEKKHLYREHKRRTGRVDIEAKGTDGERYRGLRKIDEHLENGGELETSKLIRGPYKLSYSKYLLKRLLEVEQSVREEGPDPDMKLITDDELHEIRRIWRTERHDWEDCVPQIYEDVTGRTLDWLQDDIGAFSMQEYRVLDKLCNEEGIPTDMIARLLEHERQMQGMQRRAGIFQRINRALNEDWRTEDEIRDAYDLPENETNEEDKVW